LATHTFDLEKLNSEFEAKKPEEIIAWALGEFPGRIAMTSSFGPESAALLHMVSRIDPGVPVLFLETGYHFPETLKYKEDLTRLLGLRCVIDLKADSKRKAGVVKQYEGVPYEKNPDLCCQINKVDPLDLALPDYDAWLSGIRRRDPAAVVVLDIPLLMETGRAYRTHARVVVSAPLAAAARRLKKTRGWGPGEVRRRQGFQMPLREKMKRADFVVDNGRSLRETRRQVARIWKQIVNA